MNYLIKIFYMDGKDVSVILEKDDVPRFIEAAKKGEAFWDKKQEGGFWASPHNVRYMNFYKRPQEVKDGIVSGDKSTTGNESDSSQDAGKVE